MSPSLPYSGVTTVTARRYAVTTHERCSRPPRSPTIGGSAVDAIFWSSDASSMTSIRPLTTRRMPWRSVPASASWWSAVTAALLLMASEVPRSMTADALPRRTGAQRLASAAVPCDTEPHGSVSARRPHLRGARGSHPPRRPRAPRARRRDAHRPRRAVSHVADRHEEARARARGGGARHDREGRPRAAVHARPAAPRRRRGLGGRLPADAGRPPRPVRADARANERKGSGMTGEQQQAT